MPYRIFFLAAVILCFSLSPIGAGAAERVTFQNRLGVDATVTFAGPAGGETVRIHGNLTDGDSFSIGAETLRGCDNLLVQPYFDSAFQFYLPFTLDTARAVAYGKYPPAGETRSPFLTALVGDDRISVAAGLPLSRLAALMAEGMTEKAVERWLVGLRLPGEKPGRYSVAIGESTWGYNESEVEFAPSPSGEAIVSELRLTTAWAPKALWSILEAMQASGLTPLLPTAEGEKAKTFVPEEKTLDPKAETVSESKDKAWDQAASLLAAAMDKTPATATLHLAGPRLQYTFFLDGEGQSFVLQIVRQ